jgi:hypothetical protein
MAGLPPKIYALHNQLNKLVRLADEESVRRECLGAPHCSRFVLVGRIIEQSGTFG